MAQMGNFTITKGVLKKYRGAGGDVTIPDNVTKIGERAFECCKSLTSITIPNSVTTIGDEAFKSCKTLTNITIPNSVTTIGNEAFAYCDNLASITIPNSVTTIGNYSFECCKSLTSITIPNSVTTIGKNAFMWCHSLTSITIPNSVTTIGDDAFMWCDSLTSAVLPGHLAKSCQFIFKDCSIVTFEGPVEDGFGEKDDEEFCTISGVLKKYRGAGGDITIPNSVTTIGDKAFYGCKSLKSIIIPDSVTAIGDEAFAYCEKLKSVVIPDSVTTIGYSAFWGCKNLTRVVIPDSVTTIASGTFEGCRKLREITISNPATQIDANAFPGLKPDATFHLPDGFFHRESATPAFLIRYISCKTAKDFAYLWLFNKGTKWQEFFCKQNYDKDAVTAEIKAILAANPKMKKSVVLRAEEFFTNPPIPAMEEEQDETGYQLKYQMGRAPVRTVKRRFATQYDADEYAQDLGGSCREMMYWIFDENGKEVFCCAICR